MSLLEALGIPDALVFGGCPHSSACGHITSTSASVHISFCDSGPSFPLIKSLVIAWVHPDNPRASLVTQLVKTPPAMPETPVQFLGQEDPLEKR